MKILVPLIGGVMTLLTIEDEKSTYFPLAEAGF